VENSWAHRKVTILGLAKTGRATAMYLAMRGAQVLVSESSELNEENQSHANELAQHGVKVESGSHSEEAIASADLIVTSPGIKPNSEVIERCNRLGKEVICDVELAYRESTMPIVAITGTNGKSTTTALISFLLTQAGYSAPACGNFGVPVLAALETKPDFLVIEVSSYQAYYTKQFAPQVGVFLNLTPDHLEWHGGLDNYLAAKSTIFNRMDSSQVAVYNWDDALVARTKTNATIFPFSVSKELKNFLQSTYIETGYIACSYGGRTNLLSATKDLQILGVHNLENALAAVSAVTALKLSPEQITSGLSKFAGLEHRLEYVDTIDGVRCFNDSKATNTDSAIKALQSFKEKIVLIAGGRDKGTSLDEFVQAIRKHTSAVILLGEAKNRFEKAMVEGGVQNIYSVNNLEEAVDLGVGLKHGPLVLSPACASFDMFKDFEDRGSVFKDIVRSRRKKVATSSH
jgi:UDP-N-acetylmuramoylalanine--D-glutamate ligase